jgi:hypothetical protein
VYIIRHVELMLAAPTACIIDPRRVHGAIGNKFSDYLYELYTYKSRTCSLFRFVIVCEQILQRWCFRRVQQLHKSYCDQKINDLA